VSGPDVLGFAGVALLLVAFALSAFGYLGAESRAYHALNFVGAALAGTASWLIDFMPFVVLEATWALVALAALVRPTRAAA
jgi:hypothetical protein